LSVYGQALVRYEKSGTQIFAQQPRILIYPALIVEREDGALFTVIDHEVPLEMQISDPEDDQDSVALHVHQVKMAANLLIESCAAELGTAILPSDLDHFPGFPDSTLVAANELALGQVRRIFVMPVRKASDNWIAVTGQFPHFLLNKSTVACRFNAWSKCREVHQSIGHNPICSPSIEKPRAFFVDMTIHHCANQVLADRRQDRCHIAPIDSRTCCMACAYQKQCWSDAERVSLPCGSSK